MFQIRRMAPEDAAAVAELFRCIVESLPYYTDFAKSSEIGKYSAQLLRESCATDPDSVLVAVQGDRIVGFCISRYDDSLIWLSWFGVHPSHRRQGIGSALLSALEAIVCQGRSHKIWCDCRTENIESKTALEHHHYTRLCTVRNHWYGQDFILWEKLVA